jgi:NADP-dependent 3-hydroxy acid dehydrogenase YdfG
VTTWSDRDLPVLSGDEVCRALADTGARVGMLARGVDRLQEAAAPLGSAALPMAADIADPAQVERAVAQVTEQLGPVDLLVHSAGTAEVIGPMWEADPDDWWAEVAGHLRGAMLLSRACLPAMLERGVGRIVLVYGNLGAGGDPWSTAFAAGKAGLLRLTEQLDSELADTDVCVFALHPGLVWTATTAALSERARMTQ